MTQVYAEIPTNPIKTRLKSPFVKLFIRSSLISFHINPSGALKPIITKYMSIPKQEIVYWGLQANSIARAYRTLTSSAQTCPIIFFTFVVLALDVYNVSQWIVILGILWAIFWQLGLESLNDLFRANRPPDF